MKKLSKTAALMLAAMMAVSSVGCGENTNSGGNGGGCLTNIIALCIAIFILAIIGSLFD